MELVINLNQSYNIIIENNLLDKIDTYLNLKGKTLILSDDLVPEQYYKKVLKKIPDGFLYIVKSGESSKSLATYQEIINYLINHSFSRFDNLIAVGGGVVGDLGGFVASTYMRGINFYNIPTTLLSQVDSSIGGKTALNNNGVKNIIGSFYQPKLVLIDPITLKTLDQRLICEGLSEALKMSLCFNKDLFNYFKNHDLNNLDYEYVITESLKIKKYVVENDEKELGLRRSLNFGHTLGHAVESRKNNKLYHGECVACGMIKMVSEKVKKELIPVLEKYHLLFNIDFKDSEIKDKLYHDKKMNGNLIHLIMVEEIGEFIDKTMTIDDFINNLD